MTSLPMPHHEVFKRNRRRWGRLLSDFKMLTPITGYSRTLDTGLLRCRLTADGMLWVFKNSEWDFGTGDLVVQDLAMVAASLPHDVFCQLTDRGILPWDVRMKADNFFAAMLWRYGAGGLLTAASTAWRWLGVTANSQLIARFKR